MESNKVNNDHNNSDNTNNNVNHNDDNHTIIALNSFPPSITPEQQLRSNFVLSDEGKIASMVIEQTKEQYSVMMADARQRMLDAEKMMRKLERRAIAVKNYEDDIKRRGEELDIRQKHIEQRENDIATHLEECRNACLNKDKIIAKNAVQIAELQGRIDRLETQLHPPKGPTIQLFVRVAFKKTIAITCDNNASVKDLKEMIYNREGIPCEQQRLFFQEKQLCDDRTLKEYNVQDQCTFQLVLR